MMVAVVVLLGTTVAVAAAIHAEITDAVAYKS